MRGWGALLSWLGIAALVAVAFQFWGLALAEEIPPVPQTSRILATPVPTVTPPTPKPKPKPPARIASTSKPSVRPAAPPPPPATRPSTPKPQPPASSVPTHAGVNFTALLIGVNKAPGSTPLEGSVTDVHNMRDALLGYGYKKENIKILTEGGANRNAILGALDALAKRTSGKGLAVFLLSTHSGQSGGDLTFATGGGGRISRHELAARLGRVPGKLWTMLPTCYSKGYALPGVVGKNRIAVFSSLEDERTWQLGSAGSWLVLYMIDYGVLRKGAKENTVEGLFRWTKNRLGEDAPNRVPILSDNIAGDVVLPVT